MDYITLTTALVMTTIFLLDLFMLVCLVFWVYRLFRNTFVLKIIIGLWAVYFSYLLAKSLKLALLENLLKQFLEMTPFIASILLQRELRYFLSRVGTLLLSLKEVVLLTVCSHTEPSEVDVSPTVNAVQVLSKNRTGALIVFTYNEEARYYEDSGEPINGILSSRLLQAIFNKNSPLHDGAVIVNNNKILAAGCTLPIDKSLKLASHYGLRHRAAATLSSVTNALVLIVSEESGHILIAKNGQITDNMTQGEVWSALKDFQEV